MPVVEGFINNKGIIRANVGGESISRELLRYVRGQGPYLNAYHNQKQLTASMNEWGAMVFI